MQYSNNSRGAHSAEPTRASGRKPSGSGDTLKFVLLGLVLVLVVAVLVLLFVRLGHRNDSAEVTNAAADANVTASVMAQDSAGHDMGKNITITAGTLAPPDVNPADAVLLDISWTGKKAADYPLILTISDPSFVDGNGLIVFHYENNQWVKVGTYTIADHAVTFLTNSLSPFAFVPYEKYNTPTPEPSPSPTPSASPSPTPKASPSPSPSTSPSPSPKNNNGGGNSSIYSYPEEEQHLHEEDVPDVPDEPDVTIVTPPPQQESSTDIVEEDDTE